MAISPPSDILLDVANAADPAKVRAATERLAKLAADPSAANAGFSKALSEASKGKALQLSVTSSPQVVSSETRLSMRTADPAKKDAYQKFEALMLQSFLQNMLPESDSLYGDKMSAGAFRSMMAEQLATQMAKAGGIGVAKAIETAHPALRASPGKLSTTDTVS